MNLWNAKSRRWFIFFYDLTQCGLMWFGSFWVRHNFELVPQEELNMAVVYLPLVLVWQAYYFYYYKIYRVLWRYISIQDLFEIIKSVSYSTLAVTISAYLMHGFNSIPRSVLPLYLLTTTAAIILPRFLNRILRENKSNRTGLASALVIGAGSAGDSLLRDIMRRGPNEFEVIGFVDDDIYKKGQKIHGVKVLGACSKIPRLVDKYNISYVFIALPSATSHQIRRIVSLCNQANVKNISTLPSLNDIFSGKISVDNMKGISIEDLLGRYEYKLDESSVAKSLTNQAVVVTGAGGSIGSELCLQLSRLPLKKLILIDHAEFNLYIVKKTLQGKSEVPLHFFLGSITDEIFLQSIFQKFRVDRVFHAAAYKHVPLLENQARAAVLNNIVGTYKLCDISIKNKVKNFTLISTDKAVNPTNLMGATKRIAEIICQSLNKLDETKFSIVRFGNVLGSQGSVLPLFKEQLSSGGPLTVTHRDITRYFMSIPEAANLILHSTLVNAEGRIFVLDMGEPIKIRYLAEQIIKLSGKLPYKDIDIVFTGLRPGEKMYEELFYNQEKLLPTPVKKLLISEVDDLEINIQHYIKLIKAAVNENNVYKLKCLLQTLVSTLPLDINKDVDINMQEAELIV